MYYKRRAVGRLERVLLTVMLPMISNCRSFGPTNLHITSSTVAVCIWNRSWSLGNVDSSTLISCFNTFRQAIVSAGHRPPGVEGADEDGDVCCSRTPDPSTGQRRTSGASARTRLRGQCRRGDLAPCPAVRTIITREYAIRRTNIDFSDDIR